MTNNQKANQIVFAIAHSVSKGEGSFDMKDYMTGFQVGGGGVNLSNVSLPTSEGIFLSKIYLLEPLMNIQKYKTLPYINKMTVLINQYMILELRQVKDIDQ